MRTVTPFEGSKCLLLLHLGWKNDYFRLLDRAMEQEDPLSPITLQLALCGSDTEAAIHFLKNDPTVQTVPQEEALNWLKDYLYREHRLLRLSTERLGNIWSRLYTGYDLSTDHFWSTLDYLLEYAEDGFITERDFQADLRRLFESERKRRKDGEGACS